MRNLNSTALAAASLIAVAPRAFANDGSKPRVEPVFTAVTNAIPMPERKNNRGSVSIYPFASLTAVGMSFGVKNKTASSLSSVISNANRKAVQPKKDDQGNTVFKTTEIKDANGAVVGTAPTTEPETVVTAHYFAVDVTPEYVKSVKASNPEAAKALDGVSALVFRDQ